MAIQNWSDTILLVNLAPEPEMGEELQNVIETVKTEGDKDVVVDFAEVDIVTSSSIAKLLKLRKAMVDCDHRMVLCSVSPKTRNIFAVTGLDSVFEFVEDQFLALAGLQMVTE
ncbi:MAG: STAS domain-containing protein [Sedimentisphaerales bacterium]|nr:STAS domain-containing protein [Sedimentisphaerales bacterium]